MEFFLIEINNFESHKFIKEEALIPYKDLFALITKKIQGEFSKAFCNSVYQACLNNLAQSSSDISILKKKN